MGVLKMGNISAHLILGVVIRLILIVYGEIQDRLSLVQYTDIDYRVFTDAARHIWNGNSPYQRHTYRYSPLIAAILVPNIILHPCWGKLLFSLLDILAGYLVYRLVLVQGFPEVAAKWSAMFWLYNPLAIVIATRGNADAVSAVLVLATLLYVLRQDKMLLAGALYALAVHIRLYPIAFSLPIYLSLQTVFSIWPNRRQLQLVTSCILTLAVLTSVCYWLYGYKFLHESILYHLSRHDTRHNFSVYFYMQYLNSISTAGLWQRFFTFVPQAILLLVFSFLYGSHRDLPFCLLIQAIIMVTYNPVVTSQYFVWFLSLLAPCLPLIRLSKAQIGALTSLWFASQISWLLPAYLLEFRGHETFIYIWLQGIGFFCANVAILSKLIKAYRTVKVKSA
ncbi:GPI mannosyltransferase 1 [Anabrus simplex]|uniref:GPI mannosyltransferase 1 n=1 Tax=Anabrus simplex TaxID=316456 RepID=UPI0035A3936E